MYVNRSHLVYLCYTNQNILMVPEAALNQSIRLHYIDQHVYIIYVMYKSTRLHYIESEIVIGVVAQLPST